MRHKFYIPLGFPNFAAPPSSPEPGDTYFDTLLKQVRTWDGTKWTTGGGTLTAGDGLTSTGTSMAEDITLNVRAGIGVRIINDSVTLDTSYTNTLYLLKSGDTMDGPLILSDEPTVDAQAATKRYVDGRITLTNQATITAGSGLNGGGPVGSSPTINIGSGNGIAVHPDHISVDTGFLSTIYAPIHDHPYSYSWHGHDYAATNHGHTYRQAGISAFASQPFNVPGSGYVEVAIAHGLGYQPGAGSVSAYGDSGVQSLVTSIRTWDAGHIWVMVRNTNASAGDTCQVVGIVV